MHRSCGPSVSLLLDGVLFEEQLSMSNPHSKLHPSKELCGCLDVEASWCFSCLDATYQPLLK